MAENRQSAKIRVNHRTIWIADQLYQLSNIASVDVIEYKVDQGEGRFGGNAGLRRRLVGVGVGWMVSVFVIFTVESGVGWLAIATICWTAAACRYTYHLLRSLTNRHRYALLIYSGNRVTAISSTDRRGLAQLQWLIGDAIENPPQQERLHEVSIQNLTIGDHVGGDKIEQRGPFSTGKTVFNERRQV